MKIKYNVLYSRHVQMLQDTKDVAGIARFEAMLAEEVIRSGLYLCRGVRACAREGGGGLKVKKDIN